MRRIAVVTGTRAEYGLLKWVMKGIQDSVELELQLIATGAHLSPEFGQTFKEIESDGFKIAKKVEMLLSSDTNSATAKSMGLAMIGFSDAIEELKPDLMVVLGDRYEILAAVSAALVCRIPVAHIHGGELTEGAFDDAIRHAITKMSHLHFVSIEDYRRRVIQLGEQPDRVFTVGGLGVDSIQRLKLLSKAELEESLGFRFGSQNLLITFHPATLEKTSALEETEELLAALDSMPDAHLIFTMSNSDPGSRTVIERIKKYVGLRPNSVSFASLGQLRYFSCLQFVDGVLGNSSSGLLEVPSFRKGTINIGSRQGGRVRGETVIDCAPKAEAISAALTRLYSSEFQDVVRHAGNPYGGGNASHSIVNVIRAADLERVGIKQFFDLPTVGACLD